MRARVALFALMAVIVFSAVPRMGAADGHNFAAYYLITLLGFTLLPIRWEIKGFVYVCAASCVWLQCMGAWVEPAMKSVFFRLYAAANASYQFVLIFVGLYALIIIVRPNMASWLKFLRYVALIEVMRISCQRLGWDPLYIPVAGKTIMAAAGSQGNIGWSGAMLAMCVPAFLDKRYWWGLVPVAGALYIEKSLTPVLAAAGGIFTYALLIDRGPKAGIPALLAVAGALLYFTFVDSGDAGRRWEIWKTALDMTWPREAWVLGYGLGSWRTLFNAAYEGPRLINQAHNDILQVWFELGVAGITAVAWYLASVISRFVWAKPWGVADALGRINRTEGQRHLLLAGAGMVIVAVCSMGNFPFHLAGTAVFCVGWMAMFEVTVCPLEHTA